MPFPFLRNKSDVDYKARFERKLVLARETPEPVFDLSDCNIKAVPSGVFSLCKVLRKDELLLQNNCLTSLEGGGALEDLSSLKHLNLQTNKFNKLPEAIGVFTSLKVLNVSDNNLVKLPEVIGLLISLQHLIVSNNKLKSIPAALCRCRSLSKLDVRGNPQLTRLPAELGRLHCLSNLFLDSTVQFPPPELHSSSAEAILTFLASECKSVPDFPVEMPTTNNDVESTEYFLAEERLRLFEEQKETQHKQRLALEKSLAEESLKEVEAHQRLKSNQLKLVEDVLRMQSGMDEQLGRIQDQKNADRVHLIEECLQAEKKVGEKISNILSNAKKFQHKMAEVTEQQTKFEDQLLENLHLKTKAVEKNKVLEVMEELIKEDTLKAEKWKKYENQRKEATANWIFEESESSIKLAELASKAVEDSKELGDALLCDQEIQKAAVASLLEQSDTQSWQLAQEVALVETQLAELTRLEINKRKLQLDSQIVELCENRMALTQHLVELFAQKEMRRKELLSTLNRMESACCGESFWLEQCQRLIDSTSRKLVQSLRSVDPALNQQLIFHGVGHCLPLVAGQLQSPEAVGAVTDESLSMAGVEDADERCLILKAIRTFMSTATCYSPSAPINEYEPTAPPFSPTMEQIFPYVSEECVVCMERPAEVIFAPCGHICCCGYCSELSSCPLCRADVEKVLRVASNIAAMPSGIGGSYRSLTGDVYKTTTVAEARESMMENFKRAFTFLGNGDGLRNKEPLITVEKQSAIMSRSKPNMPSSAGPEEAALLGTMPSESMDDIELRNIQLQYPSSRSLARDDGIAEEHVETDRGSLLVAVQGVRGKPAILTYHDLGLNYISGFQAFFNYADMRALLENFCIYHVNAPGHEPNAASLPEEYQYPAMEELAEQLQYVLTHFGLKKVIGFGVGAGANILARFSLAHPDLVEALCLINCCSTQAGWIEWGYQKMNLRHLRSKGVTQAVLDYLMWHHFGRGTEERNHDLVQVYKDYFEHHINPTNLALFIDAYIRRTDLNISRDEAGSQKESPTLSMAVMNITGSLSPHVDDTVTLNGRLDPTNSSWMKISDCGMVLEEQPGKVSEAFRLFLQGQGYALRLARTLTSSTSAEAVGRPGSSKLASTRQHSVDALDKRCQPRSAIHITENPIAC